eukprot:jgi/Botrbrau1/5842/Bobra.0366s0023.1
MFRLNAVPVIQKDRQSSLMVKTIKQLEVDLAALRAGNELLEDENKTLKESNNSLVDYSVDNAENAPLCVYLTCDLLEIQNMMDDKARMEEEITLLKAQNEREREDYTRSLVDKDNVIDALHLANRTAEAELKDVKDRYSTSSLTTRDFILRQLEEIQNSCVR